jgi:hypothetical protein
MTIINGIEVDIPKYNHNDDTRNAILNNEPIDETLHVIAVISNPCNYARRYILAREFQRRMSECENVTLYVVELAYGTQKFYVTDSKNKQHLQIRGDTPLWHKENMINIGIRKLLPKNWRAVAWIDADIEFENPYWALDTLRILNGCRDVVQLFSHAIDMDKQQDAMSIFPSFGYQYNRQRKRGDGINMWHPGFAWACTRRAYDKMGGLYDLSILGAGDHHMSFAFIGKSDKTLNINTTWEYKESVETFQQRVKNLRLGYVPGVIRHYYHGSKKNRKYLERWQILVKHAYNPLVHVKLNNDGLLVPSDSCPQGLLDDILGYFLERNEDE